MGTQTEVNPLFEGLSSNSVAVAQGYLSPGVYFFFVLSLILLIFFGITKKPPFDEPLTKRATLLIVSVLGFCLFFGQYVYIGYIILALIGVGLFKIRDELKQFLLITSYKKKELKMSLSSETEETDVLIVGGKSNVYGGLSFLQFFGDIKDIFEKAKYFVEKKMSIVTVYLVYINALILITLMIMGYLTYELFSTQYIIKTD